MLLPVWRRQQLLVMGVTVWLARWSSQSEEEQNRRHYVIVLALLTVAAAVVSLLRAVLTFFSLVRVTCPGYCCRCRRNVKWSSYPQSLYFQPFAHLAGALKRAFLC